MPKHFVCETGGRLNEAYEAVRKAGIDCESPKRAAWGGMEMKLTDPEGNSILLL